MSTMTEIKEALEGFRKQRADLKQKITDASKELMAGFSKEIFENHPQLRSFSWTQYTPYFNDGDTCEFGANTDYPRIQYGDEEEREDFYLSDETYNYATQKWEPVEVTDYAKEKNVAYQTVRDFLKLFDEESLEAMFGDHVEVIVTPEKTEAEEYEHD